MEGKRGGWLYWFIPIHKCPEYVGTEQPEVTFPTLHALWKCSRSWLRCLLVTWAGTFVKSLLKYTEDLYISLCKFYLKKKKSHFRQKWKRSREAIVKRRQLESGIKPLILKFYPNHILRGWCPLQIMAPGLCPLSMGTCPSGDLLHPWPECVCSCPWNSSPMLQWGQGGPASSMKPSWIFPVRLSDLFFFCFTSLTVLI